MLYLNEHRICRNYQEHPKPMIECREIAKGETLASKLTENKIFFILKGIIFLSYGSYQDTLSKGFFIVVPGGNDYTISVLEDTYIVICRLKNNLQLCEQYSIEKLFTGQNDQFVDCSPLQMKGPMELYVNHLIKYLEDGIRCIYLFDLKMKEFFFILRNYYTKEDLRMFFCPLLSHDFEFSDFVLKNHRKVKNVKEFAELANYSISGFEKRFKKVFRISAYKWMREQKAKEILHEIQNSRKAFKEIGWEYGFSSPAQFNDFCKSNFGMTPGKLRESVLHNTIQMN